MPTAEAVLAELVAELGPPKDEKQAEAWAAWAMSAVDFENSLPAVEPGTDEWSLAVEWGRITGRLCGLVNRHGLDDGIALFQAEQAWRRRARVVGHD